MRLTAGGRNTRSAQRCLEPQGRDFSEGNEAKAVRLSWGVGIGLGEIVRRKIQTSNQLGPAGLGLGIGGWGGSGEATHRNKRLASVHLP